jgi:hypothetical protein
MARIDDINSVANRIEAADTRVNVVVIDELPGAGAVRTFDTYNLDITPRLAGRFRNNLGRTLRAWPSADTWDSYTPSYMPDEGEVVRATTRVLEGSPLPAAIDRGALPEQVRLPAIRETGAHPGVHGYAVIFGPQQGERVVAVRRLDPVEQLGRGRITAFVHENRLTDADQVLAFDSGVDALLVGDEVLIRHLSAFEALFFPTATRAALAEEVVRGLGTRVRIQNIDDLAQVAREDSIFGGRLRRMASSEALFTATTARIRTSLRAFGWEHRFLVGDELRFDPSRHWRWPFLAALEDGLTQSPGSGQLYRANSQRPWSRWEVSAVVRGPNGVATHIFGLGCGLVAVPDVADQINNARASFFVGSREQPAEVLPSEDPTRGGLVAIDESAADRLVGLPEHDPATSGATS